MPARQSLPLLWLLSDARNDAGLEAALTALPRGSGFVFRHYHLGAAARGARFRELAAVAKASEHLTIVSGDEAAARDWGADGVYGAPERIAAASSPEAIVRCSDAFATAANSRKRAPLAAAPR